MERDVEALVAPFLKKIGSRSKLSKQDSDAFCRSVKSSRTLRKSQCLIEQNDPCHSLNILSSGVVQSLRFLADGSQQIVALFVPGDVLNWVPLLIGNSRSAICALNRATTFEIPDRELYRLLREHPALAHALWQEAATQAVIQQEWMVLLGRRSAYVRLAHFLCEISCRFRLSGLSEESSHEFPLTQRELGDVLGLSTVHVNRVLQQLRREGWIELTQGHLFIRDEIGLREAADFELDYLQSRHRSKEG